jgi:MFS family permease
VSFIDRFVMSLVLEPVKHQMQLSDSQLGLLVGLSFVLLYAMVGVPLGWLADRVNRRSMIAIGLFFWSCATLACGLATSFGGLFAARLAVGVGEAALVPAAMSLIAGYFARDRLARAISFFTMGASLGKTTAFLAGGAILAVLTPVGLALPLLGHLEPWQALFAIAALPGLLLVPLLFTVREIERPPVAAGREPAGFGAGLSWLRQNAKAYALHIGAACCSIMLIQIFGGWSTTMFVRVHGFTVPEAGILVGIVSLICGPAGHFAGGWLTDRLQSRGVHGAPLVTIATSLACSSVGAVALALAPSANAAIAAFAMILLSVPVAAASCLSGMQLLTPAPQRGLLTSIYMCVMTLVAVGMGPTLVGVVSDLFGGGAHIGTALVGTSVCFAGLGIVLALAGRRSFQRTADSAR